MYTRVSFVLLCAMPLVASAAEEGIKLKPQRSLLSLPPARDAAGPLFIEADRVSGHSEKDVEAEGNVQARRQGQTFASDRARYNAEREEIDASGNVRFEYGGDFLEGDALRFNLATERGFMEKPRFRLTPLPKETPPIKPGVPLPASLTGTMPSAEHQTTARASELPGRGSAERLLFQGPGLFRAEQANYTTCGPGNDDWFIRARELDIDRNRDVGTALGASIVFLDQTIFYTPYISFPLHQQRKSGLLAPHYGSASTTGAEITIPYYWNIAPNYDATFYPRLMSRRGLQLSSEFRYLRPDYTGTARFEYLPEDRQKGDDRYGYFVTHSHNFGNDWSAALNANRVSDDRYFTDLSTIVAVTSRTTLPTEGSLSKSGTWGDQAIYSLSALAQRWQTLQT